MNSDLFSSVKGSLKSTVNSTLTSKLNGDSIRNTIGSLTSPISNLNLTGLDKATGIISDNLPQQEEQKSFWERLTDLGDTNKYSIYQPDDTKINSIWDLAKLYFSKGMLDGNMSAKRLFADLVPDLKTSQIIKKDVEVVEKETKDFFNNYYINNFKDIVSSEDSIKKSQAGKRLVINSLGNLGETISGYHGQEILMAVMPSYITNSHYNKNLQDTSFSNYLANVGVRLGDALGLNMIDASKIEARNYRAVLDFSNFGMKEEDKTLGTAILEFAGSMALDIALDPYNWAKWSATSKAASESRRIFNEAADIDSDANRAISNTISKQFDDMILHDDDIVNARIQKEIANAKLRNPGITQDEIDNITAGIIKSAKKTRNIEKVSEYVYKIRNSSKLMTNSGKLSKESYGAFVKVDVRDTVATLLSGKTLEKKIFGLISTHPLKRAIAKENLIGLSKALVEGNQVAFTDYFVKYLSMLDYSESSIQLILKRLSGQLAKSVPDAKGLLKYEIMDDIATEIGNTLFEYYRNPNKFSNIEAMGDIVNNIFKDAQKVVDLKRDLNIALNNVQFLKDYNTLVTQIAGMPVLTPATHITKRLFKSGNAAFRFFKNKFRSYTKDLNFDIGTVLGKEPKNIIRLDSFDELEKAYNDGAEAMVRIGIPSEVAVEVAKEATFIKAESTGTIAYELSKLVNGLNFKNYDKNIVAIRGIIRSYCPSLSEVPDEKLIGAFINTMTDILDDPKYVPVRNVFMKVCPNVFSDLQNIKIKTESFEFYRIERFGVFGIDDLINENNQFIEAQEQLINTQFNGILSDVSLQEIAPTFCGWYKGIINKESIDFKTILNDLFSKEIKMSKSYRSSKPASKSIKEYVKEYKSNIIKQRTQILTEILFKSRNGKHILNKIVLQYFNIYISNYKKLFESTLISNITGFDPKYLNINFDSMDNYRFTFAESEHNINKGVYYYPKLVEQFIKDLKTLAMNPTEENFIAICDRYNFVFIECQNALRTAFSKIYKEAFNSLPDENITPVKNIDIDNTLANFNKDVSTITPYELDKTVYTINNYIRDDSLMKYHYSNLKTDTKLSTLSDFESIKVYTLDNHSTLLETYSYAKNVLNLKGLDDKIFSADVLLTPNDINDNTYITNRLIFLDERITNEYTIADLEVLLNKDEKALITLHNLIEDYKDKYITISTSEGKTGTKIFDKGIKISISKDIIENRSEILKINNKYNLNYTDLQKTSLYRLSRIVDDYIDFNFGLIEDKKPSKDYGIEKYISVGKDYNDIKINILSIYRHLKQYKLSDISKSNKEYLLNEIERSFPDIIEDNKDLLRYGYPSSLIEIDEFNIPGKPNSENNIDYDEAEIKRLEEYSKEITNAINSIKNIQNSFKTIDTTGEALVSVKVHNNSVTQYMLTAPEVVETINTILNPNSDYNVTFNELTKDINRKELPEDSPLHNLFERHKELRARAEVNKTASEFEIDKNKTLGDPDYIMALNDFFSHFKELPKGMDRSSFIKFGLNQIQDNEIKNKTGISRSNSLDFFRQKIITDPDYFNLVLKNAKEILPWVTEDDLINMLDTSHSAGSDIQFMFITMLTECPEYVKPFMDGTLGTTVGLDLEFEYAAGRPTTNINIANPTEIGFAFVNTKLIGKDLKETFNYKLNLDENYNTDIVKRLREFDVLLKLNKVKQICTYNGTKADFPILVKAWKRYDKEGFFKSYLYNQIIDKNDMYSFNGEHTVDFLYPMMKKSGIKIFSPDDKIKIEDILGKFYDIYYSKDFQEYSTNYNISMLSLRISKMYYIMNNYLNDIDKMKSYLNVVPDSISSLYMQRLIDIVTVARDNLRKANKTVGQYNSEIIIEDTSKIKYTINDLRELYLSIYKIDNLSQVTDDDLYKFTKDFLGIYVLPRYVFESFIEISSEDRFSEALNYGTSIYHLVIIRNIQLFKSLEKTLDPNTLHNLDYNELKIMFHNLLKEKELYKLGNLKTYHNFSFDTMYSNLWNNNNRQFFKDGDYQRYELETIKNLSRQIIGYSQRIKTLEGMASVSELYPKVIALRDKISEYFPLINNLKIDPDYHSNLDLWCMYYSLRFYHAKKANEPLTQEELDEFNSFMKYPNSDPGYNKVTRDPNENTSLENLEEQAIIADDNYHLTNAIYYLSDFIKNNYVNFSDLIESEAYKTLDNINKADAINRLLERFTPGAAANKELKSIILSDILSIIDHFKDLDILQKKEFITKVENSIKKTNDQNVIILLQSYIKDPNRLVSDIIFMEPYLGISFRLYKNRYAKDSGYFKQYMELINILRSKSKWFNRHGVKVTVNLDTVTFKLNYAKHNLQFNNDGAVFAKKTYTKNNELSLVNFNTENLSEELSNTLQRTYSNLLKYTGEMYTGVERNRNSFVEQHKTLTPLEKKNAPSISILSKEGYFNDMHFRYSELGVSDSWKYRNSYSITLSQFFKSTRHMINSMNNQDLAIYYLSNDDSVFDINNSIIFKEVAENAIKKASEDGSKKDITKIANKAIVDYINNNGYITIIIEPETEHSFNNYKVSKISYMTESALEYAKSYNAKVMPNHYASFLFKQAKANPNYAKNKEDLTTPQRFLLSGKKVLTFANWLFKVTALNPVSWINNIADNTLKSAEATGHPLLYLYNTVDAIKKMLAYRMDMEYLLNGMNITSMADFTDTAIYKLYKTKSNAGHKFNLTLDELLEVKAIYQNNPGLSSGLFEILRKQIKNSSDPKKFKEPISKSAPAKAYEILNKFVSGWLMPMGLIETVSRFAQTNTDIQLGRSHTYSYTSVSHTNFDYDFKDDFTNFAEYFIPFFNFKFLNIKYWIIKFLDDPDMITFISKWYNNTLSGYRQYTEDEINNNLSILNAMAKFRLAYHTEGELRMLNVPSSSALDAFEFLINPLESAVNSTYSLIQNGLEYVSDLYKDKKTKKELEDGTYIITFGKYKGSTINDVLVKDLPYIETIINQDWMIKDKAELRNAFITRMDGYQYVVPFGEKFIGKPVNVLLQPENRWYAQFIVMQPWCQELFPDVYNYLMANEIYKDPVMPIGKYKDKLISEVPDKYKAYMLQQDWFWKDYAYVADLFMANRDTLMPEHMIKDIGFYTNATIIGNLNNAANMITTEDEKIDFVTKYILPNSPIPYISTLYNTYFAKNSTQKKNIAQMKKDGSYNTTNPFAKVDNLLTMALPRLFGTIKTYEEFKNEEKYISSYQPEYTKSQFLNSDLYKRNARQYNYYRKGTSSRFTRAYRKHRKRTMDVAQLHLNIAQLHLI